MIKLNNKSIITFLLVTILILHFNPVNAHGGEETEPEEPISLSLETILLVTILIGIVLLIALFQIIGIDDTRFLLKTGVIALVLLLMDFIYIRYLR